MYDAILLLYFEVNLKLNVITQIFTKPFTRNSLTFVLEVSHGVLLLKLIITEVREICVFLGYVPLENTFKCMLYMTDLCYCAITFHQKNVFSSIERF